MQGAGSALMGTGSSRGDDRAVAAAEMAISSPLLEASIDGARGVLLSIQGGSDLGLFEINEAAQLVSNSAAVDANIIFGAVIDDALGDEVRVTVIAAGFDEDRTVRTPGPVAVDTPASGYAGNGSSRSPLAASSAPGPAGSALTFAPSSAGNGPASADHRSASSGPGAASGTRGPSASASAGGSATPGSHDGGTSAAPGTAPGVPGTAPAAPGTAPGAPVASRPATPSPAPAADPSASAANPAPPAGAPDAAFAASAAGYDTLLSAPVAAGAADVRAADPRDAADPAELRPAPAEAPAPKTFDIPSSRRRPVVFEEDDDLDVPDFLK
jgi:cell division protein FtsZ